MAERLRDVAASPTECDVRWLLVTFRNVGVRGHPPGGCWVTVWIDVYDVEVTDGRRGLGPGSGEMSEGNNPPAHNPSDHVPRPLGR